MRQRYSSRPACQATPRLIEGNVTIRAHSSEKQINPTSLFDFFLECDTLGCQIRCIAIEYMNVLWSEVGVLEKVLPHEAVVAFWVVLW